MHRHPLAPLLLSAAPAAALGFAAWMQWSDAAAGRTLTAVVAALGGASAVAALACALDAARMRRAFSHLRGGGGALGWEPPERQRMREQRQHEIVARLGRQVELLSAIRDLALIANDDVRFEAVLERALPVLGGFLGAREISIFLLEGPREALVPVAQLLGERTRVRGERPLLLEPSDALKALEARRTVVEAGRGGLRAAALLVADGEVVGALEVRMPRGGEERDPQELGRELENLAKHVALVLRKPTLYDRAVLDGLTGLYTKRHFQEQARHLMAQRCRLGTPLSLVILDVDHFKKVNDVHGHVAGDAVLAEVARRVRGEVRAYDQAFRYGGEEVVVLLPNAALADAVALAERLRQKLRRSAIRSGEVEIPVTASFGVAEYDPRSMPDVETFLGEADGHLYRAKRAGRDQVQSRLSAPAVEAEDEKTVADEPAPRLEAPIDVSIDEPAPPAGDDPAVTSPAARSSLRPRPRAA